MLFTQLQDGTGRAAPTNSSLPEIDALKEKACAFGPNVGGHIIGQLAPKAAGAFITAGQYDACGGYDQQREQHTATTILPNVAHPDLPAEGRDNNSFYGYGGYSGFGDFGRYSAMGLGADPPVTAPTTPITAPVVPPEKPLHKNPLFWAAIGGGLLLGLGGGFLLRR